MELFQLLVEQHQYQMEQQHQYQMEQHQFQMEQLAYKKFAVNLMYMIRAVINVFVLKLLLLMTEKNVSHAIYQNIGT